MIYAWTESNSGYQWAQYNTYQLFCGPNSLVGATVADTSASSVQLIVNDTVNYFEFADFTLTPVTDCKIQTYTMTSTTGGLNSLAGPDSSGKRKVEVTNMLVEGKYDFKITANIYGGSTHEASKSISVVCGPESKINTDPDLLNEYTMYLGEVERSQWQMT